MLDRPIFHITTAPVWAVQRASGVLTESTRHATVAEVGFIHCSFLEQVETTAKRSYGDLESDLVVLEIDAPGLGDVVRVEDIDGIGQYPHIYEAVPAESVIVVHQLVRVSGR